MGWKINDFECTECGLVFEEMYGKVSEVDCPECGCQEVIKLLSSTNIGAFSAMSEERQRQSLMNRSTTHTQKLINKEPDRWGKAGIERAEKKVQVGYKGKK